MATKKATVYLDSEDDITAVVEHVKTAKESIVALVIPKRAEVFGSLVNMKLLKRASAQAKKQTVLITDNSAITKIAGAVGVYVASSLSSKPSIPIVEVSKMDLEKPIGKLSSEASKVTDDPDINPEELTPTKVSKTKKTSNVKNKIKVPNFDSFRIKLALGILGLLLIPLLWFVGFRILPKATIKINTNATNLPATLTLASTASSESLDKEKLLIPVTVSENKQQYSEAFEATGEKQIGKKASGLMTISNCKIDDTPATIPAGTVFSSGTITFVSGVAVNLDSADFTGGGACKTTGDHVKTITVTASEAGDQFNLSSRSYSMDGVTGNVTAFGGAMSGGSSKVAKVVSAQDIESATQRLNAKKDTESIRNQLINALKTDGKVPIIDTFRAKEAEPVSSVAVDEESNGGSVSLSVTYSMAGVLETDVLEFLLPELEVKAGDLQVIDSGIATARYSASISASGGYSLEIKSTGVAGLVLDPDQVFEDIKEMPTDEAASSLRSRDGITQVEISSSPFWIGSIPNNRNKVLIEINGQ